MTVSSTESIVMSLRALACDMRTGNSVANSMIAEAADRLEQVAGANEALREALDWYAQSSNWRREVCTAGPYRNWINSRAAIDKGARAKFTLLALGLGY